LPFGDQQDFCVEFEEEVRSPVNSLVACAALCRTGSFRSSQQCRLFQASAFLVAVNRSTVLPDDGHDETCVGGSFAVFRHRDKSSAPPRVMGRLAPSAYQSAGDEWQVQSKRPDQGPFLRGISRHVKTPKFQPRFVPWTRIISSDLEQVCSRMRLPPLGSGAVRRTRCIS
jgi:hypothetical protein